MAKEKPLDPEKAARKAEKKAQKEKKRSETDGVHKSSSSSKKEKKSKDKTIIDVDKENIETTTKLLNTLETEAPGTVVVKDDTGDLEVKVKTKPLLGALVPFAHPLADEKVGKKVLKSVKKGTYYSYIPTPMLRLANAVYCFKANKNAALKRGVKEVVKSLRKSTVPGPSSTELPSGIIVLAADISPMDVISHIPVLCEDHGIPYIFVTSRAELGAASSTKRPTSVVLVGKEPGKKKKGKEEAKVGEEEDWGDSFGELVKVVQKAGSGVRI
ncbi:MAG: hypothetical protein Q9164_005407 [Protoblastenia rupestris]